MSNDYANDPDAQDDFKQLKTLLDAVNVEDKGCTEKVYRGLCSQAAAPGHLSHPERLCCTNRSEADLPLTQTDLAYNKSIKDILNSQRMTPKTAIFALLDQRNTECHWATVKAIADRAGRTKIEILYFLGTSWLHRSLAASHKPERLSEIGKWWGGDGWQSLRPLNQAGIVDRVAGRFSKELGYRFVNAYPIFQEENGSKIAFHLIHASDHPDAPKLMGRAYLKIVGDAPGVDTGTQKDLFPD